MIDIIHIETMKIWCYENGSMRKRKQFCSSHSHINKNNSSDSPNVNFHSHHSVTNERIIGPMYHIYGTWINRQFSWQRIHLSTNLLHAIHDNKSNQNWGYTFMNLHTCAFNIYIYMNLYKDQHKILANE